ncbi:protein takeout-like [Schistocerca americana]|uniref:protein takeout-like n=1 Tax=Schistocerca americana TaxID=7009 RepID=UPI001F4F232E|nr:protein takeout-like [Schistocerca americana]
MSPRQRTSALTALAAAALVGAFVPAVLASHKLPPYIKPCSQNDIHLDECALRSARAALPGIIKGDRKFGVQPLDPLRLTEVLLEQGRGLSLALRDVDVIGLHATDINSVRLDLPKDTVIVNLTVPHIEILGKYVVKGKIMVLPITGKGNANITLDDVRVSYTFQHDLVRKADGKQYIRGKNNSLTLTAGWGSAHLDNLFNGDKRLGDAMNKFINENWRIVMEEIRAPIEETIVQVVERILTSFTSKVPYEEILLA